MIDVMTGIGIVVAFVLVAVLLEWVVYELLDWVLVLLGLFALASLVVLVVRVVSHITS